MIVCFNSIIQMHFKFGPLNDHEASGHKKAGYQNDGEIFFFTKKKSDRTINPKVMI